MNNVESKFLFFISAIFNVNNSYNNYLKIKTIKALFATRVYLPYRNTLLQVSKIKENIGKLGFC